MSNFVVEFKLKTEIYQEHILEKRFEIARHIYNSLVTKPQKRYRELVKTKKYREVKKIIADCFAKEEVLKEENKKLGKENRALKKENKKLINESEKLRKLCYIKLNSF